ncbi:UNVERIFIED_CONTAM: hypothetical protein Slati_2456700 [Sesamum latifolium]|uniref:Ty3-gypsy retrotransposon protein n=1 Tax=Sesamum latifolium TaxID=2727402 RepID=A0AAW2WD26_9LAMI
MIIWFMVHSSSTSSKAEIATVMMVETTSLKEQIASLTAVVGNLLKYVQARDDQLNELHDKFQSTPTLNEFEEQGFSVECNTSKGIHVSTGGFVSIEHVKNTVNGAITNIYKIRVQVFKSYFVETYNNVGTDGDLLAKQFGLSLKDAAFDWYIDLEANSINSWDDL